MSSMMSLSDRSTLKHIGIGITLFVGGGLVSYAVIQFWSSNNRVQDPDLSRSIVELKREIINLKGNLSDAVVELRKELDGIRGSINPKKRTTSTRSRSGTALSIASGRTAGTFQTACSDYDDDFPSDDEFLSPPDHIADDVIEKQPLPGSDEELNIICVKVDLLNEGTDEDREEAMRILQDNELNHKDSWQLLWRLCRSHVGAYDMRDAYDERCLHAMSALEYAKQAISLNDNSADVHKWYAISLGATTDFVGTKEKIEYGYELKEHIERALEIQPDEPTLHFMLGRWCWGVYMLTWIERKLAATLFATPPTATVDDALKSFLKAEEIDPGFYKSNQYYVAKCYYEKSDYSNAKKWLQCAAQLPCKNKDDRDTHRDLQQLLAKL
nr:regulator of microtubule dynamics protein 3 [Ciona intestinalis]|eukprot:XP_026690145.1 regulator of microtubule dynamics protein 3 [Ciona intestinalis]